MTSQPVALLPATLGVVPSHSRPHVSDDNPFSEAQFKTLTYRAARGAGPAAAADGGVDQETPGCAGTRRALLWPVLPVVSCRKRA